MDFEAKSKSESEALKTVIRETDERVLNLFENSLDESITDIDNITKRQLTALREKSKKAQDDLLEQRMIFRSNVTLSFKDVYETVRTDMDDLLSEAYEKSIHVITSHVGDGKTIEMAKMSHMLRNDPKYRDEYIPLFYSRFSNFI